MVVAVGINLVKLCWVEFISISIYLLTGSVTGAFLRLEISAGFISPHKSTMFFPAIHLNRACRLHTVTPYMFAGRTYPHKKLAILTDSFHQILSF
jgi:hypothetical protein